MERYVGLKACVCKTLLKFIIKKNKIKLFIKLKCFQMPIAIFMSIKGDLQYDAQSCIRFTVVNCFDIHFFTLIYL